MLSIMKTSIYLAETAVSDMFIVSSSSFSFNGHHTDPERASSYIGAISFGMRASLSSRSPCFYMLPT